MAKLTLKLDGHKIKTPSNWRIERYPITKGKRTANGKAQLEIIAYKHKFYFQYPALDSYELNELLDILWRSDTMFHELTYIEDNIEKTATVYYGMIPAPLHRTGSVWMYKDVNFQLIEQ